MRRHGEHRPGTTSTRTPRNRGDVMIELRNTVAHELFHCVQNWAWPGKMPSAVGKDAKWWVEGTAEMMGHAVFESIGT